MTQITTLSSLSAKYDSSKPISEFAPSSEAEWPRPYKLAPASQNTSRKKYAESLSEDKAKRDRLPGYLVNATLNVVDNPRKHQTRYHDHTKEAKLGEWAEDLDDLEEKQFSDEYLNAIEFQQTRKSKANLTANLKTNS